MAAYHCCVPFCNSDARYNADKKISFHRIPAFHVEPQRHRDWLTRIRREPGPNFKVSSCTRVCSKHFHPSDFVRTLTGKRNLKPYSVPCIFQWTTNELTEEQMSLSKKNSGSSKNTLQPILPSQPAVQKSKPPPPHPADMTASILDHCYDLPPMTDTEMLHAAREEITRLQQRNATLEKSLFFLERFSADPSLIHFYTGFKDYPTLKIVFSTLTETEGSSEKWKQCQQEGNAHKQSRLDSETMLQMDQFFLFLCKVRQGFHDQDLSIRFNVSQTLVTNIVITWAHYLYLVLGEIPLWRSRETAFQEVPECFRAFCPRTRVTLHCAEIKVQTSGAEGGTSPIYCNHVSYKGLLGIAPHGAVIFISPLYSGRASTRDITKSSGIMDLLEPGDWVITDQDFDIQDLVESVGAFVVVPPIITAALPRECHEAAVMFGQASADQNTMYILASSSTKEGQETLVVTTSGSVEHDVVKLEQPVGEEEFETEERVVEEVVTVDDDIIEVSIGDEMEVTEVSTTPNNNNNNTVMKDVHDGCEVVICSAIGKRAEEPTRLGADINSLARLRICINQDIDRVRQYRLFDHVLPFALAGITNQLWAVCAMLTNINGSLS